MQAWVEGGPNPAVPGGRDPPVLPETAVEFALPKASKAKDGPKPKKFDEDQQPAPAPKPKFQEAVLDSNQMIELAEGMGTCWRRRAI